MIFKKISLWIVIGIFLRLVVMPFTIHPDLRGHYLGSYFIVAKGQLFGFYDYISRLPRTDPIAKIYGDGFLVYSPLTYLFHAAYLAIVYPVFPEKLYLQLVTDMGQAVKNPGIYYLIFLLKLPYLLVDMGCLWLMLKLADEKHRRLAAILWAFDLPVIYSAFLIGQFDILMVVFIFLGLYLLLKKNKPHWSAVSLAVAAAFKPFPLFLLPFLPGNKIKNLVFGGLTYLVIIAPYLPSRGYRMYALMAEQSDKMWYARIMVSGSQYLPLFAVGLVFLFWLNLYRRPLMPDWAWLSAPLLLFFSVTHYHPQWFAWLVPFLFMSLIYIKKSVPVIIALLIIQLFIILSFESSLNFGLFGIDFYPFAFLSRYYPADQFVSLVRGALTGTILGFIWVLAAPPEKSKT